MRNTESSDTSMETSELLEKGPSVSRDEEQPSSQATSSINLVHVSNPRLLTHEPSTNPTEIVQQTPKQKNICGLSVDVLVFIADSLPPDTAALLSISCKTLWLTLGSKYVKALKTPYRVINLPVSSMYMFNADIRLYRSYRYNFLLLLARDLPDHITCYPCNRLHPMESASFRGLHYTRCALHVDNTLHLLKYDVRFPWLQRAMKRFRQSRSSDPILFHDEGNIFSGKTSKLVEVSHESIQFSHTSNSIILRNQGIVFLPARHQYPIFEHSIAGVPRSTSWTHPICPHLKWACFYELHTRRLRVSEIPFTRAIFQSCDDCKTDYHVELRDHGEEGDALLFTSWMDLGSGESAREFNWQNAIRDVARQGRDTVSPCEYEHGSVCEAYEGIPGRRYKLEYDMVQDSWELVDRYRISSGRHSPREKKLPLSILTARNDVTLRLLFESLRM
ncbi:hypothetical protein BOTCAL_0196g00130 [Botryotinia calthae]|uniref:Uncharacterized protein n=1 Tax=Botryotinia calthae TaxID=38488 RepID=A0A4Y8D208_9HELO|nr:hypothetical protein BOTCAL_0196g00130 [Botryotinia calthae]